MSKINFNWKVGEVHLCKITNPKKDNYGKIIRVYRGRGDYFFSNDHDDWYEEDYEANDFEVRDVDNESDTVNVNVNNENYWREFTITTAREIFVKMEPKLIGNEKDMAKSAVKFAKALTAELKKL